MSAAPYDAIVIGSGAGGATAAYRMVRGGLRVLHLEKGAHLPVDGSTLDVERVVHRGEFLAREPWVDGQGGALESEEHINVRCQTKWYCAALLRCSTEETATEARYRYRGWP